MLMITQTGHSPINSLTITGARTQPPKWHDNKNHLKHHFQLNQFILYSANEFVTNKLAISIYKLILIMC